MKKIHFLLRLFLPSALACSCSSIANESTLTSHRSVTECPASKFESFEYEHMSYEIQEIFHLKHLTIDVVNESGAWPAGTVIHVQAYLFGSKSPKAFFLQKNSDGFYSSLMEKPGFYCLKISTEGWQTAQILVRFDPEGEKDDPAVVELILGV